MISFVRKVLKRSNIYLSCSWIENGLAFARKEIAHCCIAHHDGLGWPIITNFYGGVLPVEKVVKARKNLRKRVIRGSTFPHPKCEGCKFLITKKWKPGNYLFEQLNFSHFTQCNLRCKYCWLNQIDQETYKQGAKPFDIYPVITDLIKNGYLSPKAETTWGGGEPTLLKSFSNSLNALVGHGCTIRVATNSTIFSDAIYDALVNKADIRIITSIDCGTPEKYKEFKGKDLFYTVFKNLGSYAASGGIVIAKYVLSDENCDSKDLEGFIDNVIKYGIREVWVDVDANLHSISKNIVLAAQQLQQMLKSNDIIWHIAGAGLNSFPELQFEEKVRVAP